MTVKLNVGRILGWGAVFIVVVFTLYACQMNRRIWGPGSSYTTNMEPVEITLQNSPAVLRIPKAYLTFRENWKGGEQEFVVVEFTYPDMAPTKRNKRAELQFSVKLKGTSDSTKHGLIKDIADGKAWLEPTGFGLDRLSAGYHEDRKVDKAPRLPMASPGPYNSYYSAENGRYVAMDCERKRTCSVYTSFSRHLTGNYYISSKYVPEQWKEIDGNIVQFIRSLEVLPENSEK